MWSSLTGRPVGADFRRVDSVESFGSAQSKDDIHELDLPEVAEQLHLNGNYVLENGKEYILEGVGYDDGNETHNDAHGNRMGLERRKKQAVKMAVMFFVLVAIVFIIARGAFSQKKTLKVAFLMPHYDENDKVQEEFVHRVNTRLVHVDKIVDEVNFDGPIRVVQRVSKDTSEVTMIAPTTIRNRRNSPPDGL